MAKQRVPVSARAILQRINRKLKPDWKQLKTGRGLLLERTGIMLLIFAATASRSNMLMWKTWRGNSRSSSLGRNCERSWGWPVPEKDREAKGDRLLWEDTTLSRHSEIERNCEIRPATAFGGEVWGPWRSNAGGYGLWGAIRPNACKRLIDVLLPPVPSVATQVIPEISV